MDLTGNDELRFSCFFFLCRVDFFFVLYKLRLQEESENTKETEVREGGGGIKGVLNNIKKNCRISKEVHPFKTIQILTKTLMRGITRGLREVLTIAEKLREEMREGA